MNTIKYLLTIVLICCSTNSSKAETGRVFEKWIAESDVEKPDVEKRELCLYKDLSCEEKVTFKSEVFFNACRYEIVGDQFTIIYGDKKVPSSQELKMKFTIVQDSLYLFGHEVFIKEKTNKFKNNCSLRSQGRAENARPF